MDENTRVTLRLPADMVERLEVLIANGRYGNLSEAISDCIREYLDSHPGIEKEIGERKIQKVNLETLTEGEPIIMEELIRDAVRKYTKDHIKN